jgi:hypothetical protein
MVTGAFVSALASAAEAGRALAALCGGDAPAQPGNAATAARKAARAIQRINDSLVDPRPPCRAVVSGASWSGEGGFRITLSASFN